MKIIEAVKANKKALIRGLLIVGGTIAGLTIAAKMLDTGEESDELFESEDNVRYLDEIDTDE